MLAFFFLLAIFAKFTYLYFLGLIKLFFKYLRSLCFSCVFLEFTVMYGEVWSVICTVLQGPNHTENNYASNSNNLLQYKIILAPATNLRILSLENALKPMPGPPISIHPSLVRKSFYAKALFRLLKTLRLSHVIYDLGCFWWTKTGECMALVS